MNFRSINFWMNVGFGVVLIGLVVGASSQPWFFVIAVAWVVFGFVLISRSRRDRPQPPSLFDDEDETHR